jgi:hypothetical protein
VESKLGPLGTSATQWPNVPAPVYDDGEFGGMKICRGNRSTRRKSAPTPLCPPQIPLDQTGARTRGRRGGKPATNRLSYGAALIEVRTFSFRRTTNILHLIPIQLLWCLLFYVRVAMLPWTCLTLFVNNFVCGLYNDAPITQTIRRRMIKWKKHGREKSRPSLWNRTDEEFSLLGYNSS